MLIKLYLSLGILKLLFFYSNLMLSYCLCDWPTCTSQCTYLGCLDGLKRLLNFSRIRLFYGFFKLHVEILEPLSQLYVDLLKFINLKTNVLLNQIILTLSHLSLSSQLTFLVPLYLLMPQATIFVYRYLTLSASFCSFASTCLLSLCKAYILLKNSALTLQYLLITTVIVLLFHIILFCLM